MRVVHFAPFAPDRCGHAGPFTDWTTLALLVTCPACRRRLADGGVLAYPPAAIAAPSEPRVDVERSPPTTA